ncbi:MAG: class I SAM-dependent methyltransferase [Thermodesulfobacteriota bacterium]
MKAAQKIAGRYAGEQGKIYHDAVHRIPARAIPWLVHLRREKLSPHVRASDVVLEYGVGMGWNLAGLTCARRIGIDVAEHLESTLESLGIAFVADPARVADGSIDVVICHHVLEHIAKPLAALENMHRMLRDNGRLVLVVPYETGRKYRRYDPLEPNRHLYSWNVQSLGNLVESTGFRAIEASLKRYGYDRFAAVWAERLSLGEVGFRMLRRLLQGLRPLYEVFVVCEKEGTPEKH